MKKTFQMIGLISLTCFSFFITEKTAIVVSNMDDIMIEIKENESKYNSEAIDAIIDNNTIIPGVNGKTVNINKSYKAMKDNGYYSDKLFVYDYISPNISLISNNDKYIIKGNPSKRIVSLIFKVEARDNIEDILNIVNNYNIKTTFFVDPIWFTNNNNLIQIIVSKGHTLAPLLDDYSDSNFEWMDMILKKVNKQKKLFCYSVDENKENIDTCKLRGNYTIKPTLISENTPLVDIKEKLESGSLLSLKVNSQVRKELSTIIIYIRSKGYKIGSLEENVLE